MEETIMLLLHFFKPGSLTGPDAYRLIDQLESEVRWLKGNKDQIYLVTPHTFGTGPGRVGVEIRMPLTTSPKEHEYTGTMEMYDELRGIIMKFFEGIECYRM